MATSMKRFMLTVTPEMEQTLDELKQEKFYNKSYSEMYRHILAVGISAMKPDDSEKQEETQEETQEEKQEETQEETQEDIT